jgi:hypothetical protein
MALTRHSSDEPPMDTTTPDFVHAGSLDELKAKGRLVLHGRHRPICESASDRDPTADPV